MPWRDIALVVVAIVGGLALASDLGVVTELVRRYHGLTRARLRRLLAAELAIALVAQSAVLVVIGRIVETQRDARIGLALWLIINALTVAQRRAADETPATFRLPAFATLVWVGAAYGLEAMPVMLATTLATGPAVIANAIVLVIARVWCVRATRELHAMPAIARRASRVAIVLSLALALRALAG